MGKLKIIPTVDEPKPCAVRRFTRAGNPGEATREIQRESFLTVNVNDIPTLRIGCSASHLVELVCGRLFTEGLVRGLDEIDGLTLFEDSMHVDVHLRNRTADLSRTAAQRVTTYSTHDIALNDCFAIDEGLRPVAAYQWQSEWIYDLAAIFELDRTTHRRTHGSHSAYLAQGADVLYLREDLGRHNAFDKAVGSALIDGVDLTRCLLFISGRVPTDMAAKAVRAGIPLLVSKAVPTDRTVEMARQYGLTLICNATSSSFNVYNDPLGISH